MKYFLISLILLGISSSGLAQEAEKHPFLKDKFYVSAGIFIPQKELRFGAEGDITDDIDFGQSFDFNDNQTTFFFHGEWRWNKKWRLTGEYFAVNNAARATLERDIEFENITFEAGSFVRAGVDFSLWRIFVGRTISSGPKHSLGAGLGVHAMNIGAFIEGEAKTSIGDKEFRNPKFSVLLPLPNIGGWYHWAPTPKWVFLTRVDWFGLTIDQYGGSLWNVAPGVKYQIIKNFGIGVDYRFLFLSAKVNESDWKGRFNMDFTGPTLTLHGNF